jgi:DNA-directed RNA polymerase subunit beta'
MRTFHTGGVAGEDITHGLPRVTELFEARKPKGQAILAEVEGTLAILDEPKSRTLTVTAKDGHEKAYTVSRRSRLRPGVVDGVTVELGQQLTEGSVNPHDLLHLKGPNETLRYIVEQVQDVYRSQGVDINDKHIEVIARQMLRRVSITEPGSTDFLPGQLVDRLSFANDNELAMTAGGEPANGYPVLLGITKASLATESFLSAASFQETTRVLTDAAIAGKDDDLLGLKENVIIGKLIPAATGMKRYRSVKLTYKGQNIEAAPVVEGPLPEWAPEELREIEALLPVAPEPAPFMDSDFESAFADLALDDEGEIDISAFTGITFDPTASVRPEVIEGLGSAESVDVAKLSLSDIGVGTRWVKLLAEQGIVTVGDLKGKSEADLLMIQGVGTKALEELETGLERFGLTLDELAVQR